MPTIEKRGSGYRITVSAGYDMQGKQIKKRMTWTPLPNMTEKQIQKELERQAVLFEENVISGKAVGGAIKLEDFIEQWFDDYAASHLRNLSIQRYRQLTKRIYPALGYMRIDRIQPHNLVSFYRQLGETSTNTTAARRAKENLKRLIKDNNISYKTLSDISGVSLRTVKAAVGGDNVSAQTTAAICKALKIFENDYFTVVGDNGHKLAEKTVKQYHIFLSSVMDRAVKWGLISDNPCKRVDAPKVTRHETKYLSVEQAAVFLEKLTDEPLEWQVIFNMLLLTGMRRGELMGLEWSDVDFDNLTVTISRTSQYTPEKGIYTDTTKTEQSKRIISMPDNLIQLLRRYRAEINRRRFALGDKWVDSNRLFIKWNGEPMHPNTPYSQFQKLLKKYGLPSVSLHSLRHTNATIMIVSGTDIRTVSGRLGHSQTSTTLNIYAHLMQSADKNAADVVSSVLCKHA